MPGQKVEIEQVFILLAKSVYYKVAILTLSVHDKMTIICGYVRNEVLETCSNNVLDLSKLLHREVFFHHME